MSFLVRRGVGKFALEDTVSVEELAELKAEALLPMDAYLEHIMAYDLPEDRLKAFTNGLLTHDRQFIARYQVTENVPLRVYCQDNFVGMGHFDVSQQAILPDKVIIR